MNFDSYSTAIWDQFKDASDTMKRVIALAACRVAVAKLIPEDTVVQQAIRALSAGKYRDRRPIESLDRHVEDLDGRYFDAQEACDAGRGDRQTVHDLFIKARAASAVSCAFNPDATLAMRLTVYEACAAVGVEPVAAEINRVVGRVTTSVE
jgi:hypothetical protein